MAAAIAVVLIGTGFAWADLADGLVAHWKLDGNANDSTGSNDGTLVNGPIWTTGQIDGALSFSGGDDYVDCGNSFASVTGSTTKTITAWAMSDISDLSGRIITLYRRSDSYSAFVIYPRENNGDDPATWKGLYATPGNGHKLIDSEVTVTAGEWTCLALVQDGSDVHIYVNGELENSASDAAAPTMSNPPHAVMGTYMWYGHGPSASFLGTIDDVRIYERALTDGEVEQLYQVGVSELVSLEIVGADEVAEDSQGGYRAIAVYDDNSTMDVTDSAVWSVEPDDIADVTAGLLTTEAVDLSEDIIISAEYTEGDVNQTAERQVSVLNICPSGSALEFDGVDDYVNVPDDESLQLEQSLTIEAWVKPIYDGGDYRADAIIVKGENVGWGPHFNYRIAMENSSLYTWGVCKSGQELFFHGGTPEYNKWQHLALTADGSICRAYVNGVEVASRSAPGPYLTFPGYPLQIGGHGVTGARWFSGLIDEVCVWSIARTVDQIKTSMHIRLQGSEPGLVGYWNFEEGVDQFTHDSSGNGNNGTLGSGDGADDSDPAWVESDVLVGICTPLAVDIKPGSCPNPLNLKSNGVLPVAILGSADFDVNSVDAVSIRLADVPAIRHSYEDVASPVTDSNECECSEEGGDGYLDLTLKFKTQQIVEELLNSGEELVKGQTLMLALTGELSDGTSVEGADCVKLVGNVSKWLAAQRWDGNADGAIDFLDLAELANYWLETSEAK